ncbi:uncharacterized protein K452DRAFT_230434 [Aplosporella prunicola CBS 121167]|uniref:PQ-loop repeat-containing protein n=1 Tax=Aplosporella prunicola CBS 121167 TaxID=1176127 RepID=A0A6A6BBD2_9PEZI|nr:uncharacterized protein K452DRAFT_230434 [Aplosporella prunicola CBS 121167]KAF2140545.1 hypothetical protein K452DRAFT_230434 [Aplosporella prunicola CBS 121167]
MSTTSWTLTLHPALPEYCEPENGFLRFLSSTFHTCVPTNLAFLSTLLGTLSVVSWLFAQLPQIYKNYTLKSTSGLSIFFLSEWLLGDVSNLVGSVLTKQALWQVIIATYYCFVDFMLVGQWLWYERLRHGRPLIRVWRRGNKRPYGGNGPDDLSEVIDGMSVMSESETISEDSKKKDTNDGSDSISHSDPKDVFRSPRYSSYPSKEGPGSLTSTPSRTITRTGRSNSPMPSPRTALYLTMLLAVVARASPLTPPPSTTSFASQTDTTETPAEIAGRLSSWLCTMLYLGSRLPQLYKNYIRKSTAGLSPTLFLAAFLGNLFYSSSIATNPCAWGSYPAHGAGGWVDEEGSQRGEWISRAVPFWLGAAGVLIMDAAVGVQLWYYGEAPAAERAVVVVPEEGGKKWRWRRVSGWMRGWIPAVSELPAPRAEEERLLGTRADGRYGAV